MTKARTIWRTHRSRRLPRLYARWQAQIPVGDEVFGHALQIATGLLPNRRVKARQLDLIIRERRARATASNLPEDWLVALYIQAPRAAEAQQQMDANPHGYHDDKARLYELIDFNDTFVATILAMNDHERSLFAEQAKIGCDVLCEKLRSARFSNEQWTAIVRGLTREIAVYRAARDRGFDAFMPNRSADAMGVDIQVRDPETGRYINLDVKTPSSYRHRLEELMQQGRIDEQDLLQADERSYLVIGNGKHENHVTVVMLCMLPDKFGEFGQFRLLNSEPMRETLNYLIRQYGLSDGRYGIWRSEPARELNMARAKATPRWFRKAGAHY